MAPRRSFERSEKMAWVLKGTERAMLNLTQRELLCSSDLTSTSFQGFEKCQFKMMKDSAKMAHSKPCVYYCAYEYKNAKSDYNRDRRRPNGII